MNVFYNTSSCLDNHLCHIIYKSQPSYGQIRTGLLEICTKFKCGHNDMVLVHDTLFSHDDHLYQIIFEYHYA